MTAQDYNIYFPYGAQSPPYSKAHPHRGEDRCNKWGVPVVVEGIQIGLVGATGLVFDAAGNLGTPAAAHLHIQEWSGDVSNTRKPQNSFKGGMVIQTAHSSDFGNYVTIQKDGWNTSYCHLEKITIKVGQEIGGDIVVQDADFNVLSQTFKNMTGRSLNRNKKEWSDQIGRKWQDVLVTFQGSPEAAAWYAKASEVKTTPLPKGLYEVK